MFRGATKGFRTVLGSIRFKSGGGGPPPPIRIPPARGWRAVFDVDSHAWWGTYALGVSSGCLAMWFALRFNDESAEADAARRREEAAGGGVLPDVLPSSGEAARAASSLLHVVVNGSGPAERELGLQAAEAELRALGLHVLRVEPASAPGVDKVTGAAGLRDVLALTLAHENLAHRAVRAATPEGKVGALLLSAGAFDLAPRCTSAAAWRALLDRAKLTPGDLAARYTLVLWVASDVDAADAEAAVRAWLPCRHFEILDASKGKAHVQSAVSTAIRTRIPAVEKASESAPS